MLGLAQEHSMDPLEIRHARWLLLAAALFDLLLLVGLEWWSSGGHS